MSKRSEQIQAIARSFVTNPTVGKHTVGATVLHVDSNDALSTLHLVTHGNAIAFASAGLVAIRTLGWNTNLTANVLNAMLLGLGVTEKVVRRGGKLRIGVDILPNSDYLILAYNA